MFTFTYLILKRDDLEILAAYKSLLQRLLNLMFRNSDLSESS